MDKIITQNGYRYDLLEILGIVKKFKSEILEKNIQLKETIDFLLEMEEQISIGIYHADYGINTSLMIEYLCYINDEILDYKLFNIKCSMFKNFYIDNSRYITIAPC